MGLLLLKGFRPLNILVIGCKIIFQRINVASASEMAWTGAAENWYFVYQKSIQAYPSKTIEASGEANTRIGPTFICFNIGVKNF